MLQRSSENIPELLVVLLKLTFDVMAKKQKHRQTLHPLLYVVNKGIVLRLSKGKHIDFVIFKYLTISGLKKGIVVLF